MRLGMMNDPRLNACDEARWAAEHGFDFLDLTIEGPGADLENLDVPELQSILNDTGLGAVGHTAWYLPFASPIARVRQAAIESAVDTFETFATLGVKWVTVHITRTVKTFQYNDLIRWNSECFAQLAERAVDYGVGVMVEHNPDPELKLSGIRQIMNVDKRLGFHLDVGHANVGGDRLEGFLKSMRHRLVHVHLSDNFRRNDDHLPLGTGRINWRRVIQNLIGAGYDDTITIEVFSADRDYLLLSAQKIRQLWDDVIAEAEALAEAVAEANANANAERSTEPASET